jgi:hypothetical protein
MYSMQYAITLPTDYDMQIIRDRVQATGHLMDGFDGLEFKAYLIQEKAHGAPRNVYAPFYVWRDIDGMRKFCWSDPGYSAIVRDFGRHPIQDWTVAQLAHGPADYSTASSLTMKTVPLPEEAAPSQCLDSVTKPFMEQITHSNIARLAAVDLTSWNVILVELSSLEPDQASPDSTSYEVLHVSASA